MEFTKDKLSHNLLSNSQSYDPNFYPIHSQFQILYLPISGSPDSVRGDLQQLQVVLAGQQEHRGAAPGLRSGEARCGWWHLGQGSRHHLHPHHCQRSRNLSIISNFPPLRAPFGFQQHILLRAGILTWILSALDNLYQTATKSWHLIYSPHLPSFNLSSWFNLSFSHPH